MKKKKLLKARRKPGRFRACLARFARFILAPAKWTLLAFFPARLAATSFLGDEASLWFLSFLGACLVGTGLARLFRSREEAALTGQYLQLLAYLSTRLAAGVPLEAAFIEAPASLADQTGRHNPVYRSLLKLKKNLESQMSLHEALDLFSLGLGLSACRRDFMLLVMLARTGGRADIFIRQIHLDLAAQISARDEVASEQRGQATEALIMSVVPFVIASFILQKVSTFSPGPMPDLTGPLTFLYLASMATLFILLFLLAPAGEKEGKRKGQKGQVKRKGPCHKEGLNRLFSRLYLDFLPARLGARLRGAVLQLNDHMEEAWYMYMEQKKRDILYGCLLALLLALTGRLPLYLLILVPFFFSGLRDLASFQLAGRLKEEHRFYYPSVISSLYSLMESGLTLDRSLRLLARVHGREKYNPVSQALKRAGLLLETGYDSGMAVKVMADHCPLPEIQAALRLMARYQREGGGEILELIRIQAERSRELYRDALRGRAKQRAVFFVFPMAMDLLIVVVTVTLPAFAGIQSLI